MKTLLVDIDTEEVTADCVGRKIKTMKTSFSQEVNNIIKSNKSGHLYNPKLMWFDGLR